MAVTEQQVRAYLEPEEPNYSAAAQLGPDALPVLEQLVRGPDPLLASKAAYLAALIPHENAARVLEAAAKSGDVTVRVAAAAGLRRMPQVSENIMMDLVDDLDEGVRKVALKSIKGKMTPKVRGKVQERASREHNPALRAAYAVALETPTGVEQDEITAHGGGSVSGSAGAAQPLQGVPGEATGQGGGQTGTAAMAGPVSTGGPEGGGGGDLGAGATSAAAGAAGGPDSGVSAFGGGQI
jgi:hypothetical protein